MNPQHKPKYPWESPRKYPRAWGIPPVEDDPWHVPGGPKDVTPPAREFPETTSMPPLPSVWGARLPAFETYRPWASQPNGVVGQHFQMTMADVVYAYTSNWDMPDQSTATHAQMVASREIPDQYVLHRIWDANDFVERVFGKFPIWTTPAGKTPDKTFYPMPWEDFFDILGIPVEDIESTSTDNAQAHRQWLVQRILEHFWLREVRGETAEQSFLFLRRHMMEAMPSINPVFMALENLDPDTLRDDTDSTLHTDTTDDATSDQTSHQVTQVDSSSTSITSTNPLQSKVLHTESDYYDTGAKTDSTSTSTTDATANTTSNDVGSQDTHNTGYTARSLSRTLTEWVRGVNNGLYLVFAELEPCFSQLWEDHQNSLY